jgi:hypothetical protein
VTVELHVVEAYGRLVMSVRCWGLTATAAVLAVTGQALVTTPAAPVGSPDAGAAAPTWGPVLRLDRTTRGQSLVVDARNHTTVVWATTSAPPRIVVVRHPSGGSWGKRVVIGQGYAPRVAADRRGNITVAWLSQRAGFTDGVLVARRPAGGRWSDPVRLTDDLSVPGYSPGAEGVYGAANLDLDVSPRGAAVVAWDWGSDDRDVPWRIRSAYRPEGGPWRAPQDVTPAAGANTPLVGIAGGGTVVLVHGRQLFGHPQVLKARRRLADGRWTEPTTVAAEGYTPSLVVDRAGNAVVAFTPDFNKVQVVRRPAAGRWGPARTLSPAGAQINDFALAMNGRGTAVVALGRGSGRVDLVRRPPQGPWSALLRVARPGTVVTDVLVDLNGDGDTFVGWGGYALYGKYLPRGGDWSGRFTLSPDAGVEVLEWTSAAVGPGGDVAVLWKQEERPLKVRLMDAS